jgi:hypothetical protein
MEGVMRGDLLGVSQVSQLYRVGDALTVHGKLELRSARMSILVERLEVTESWEHAFPKAAFQIETDAINSADAATVLLQCTSSHVERLTDHLRGPLSLETFGSARPTSATKHAERGVLARAPDVPALVAAIRADRALTRVVQRIA